MNIALFSIKRPIFITSIVLLMMIIGMISFRRLGVDMFPNVEIPVVAVTTIYQGATSEEIENLVSRPIEDELSSISGLKKLSSTNQESVSVVVAEFTLETDFKFAEQQMRDKIAKVRSKLPDDIEEPLFQRFDPSNTPILKLALQADLKPAELFDLAKEVIRPQIEQIDNVGTLSIIGGTRREIQIELDRNKLNWYTIPAVAIANQLKSAGANVPVGKFEKGTSETAFRSIGQFEKISQIENAVVSFGGDFANGVRIKDLGTVKDGTEDPVNYGFIYYPQVNKTGEKTVKTNTQTRSAVFLDVYKQAGSNTVAVSEAVVKKVEAINGQIKEMEGKPQIIKIYDGARPIRINIDEVNTSILLGILLAALVVYLFLGNIRSTVITGIAIPNSLLGAFILMYAMGFTINIMTLMALSLTVGLLVDDAIVVRENIFRKLESGMKSFKAAEVGTLEVMLAVVATTLTVIAVFFPIGFLQGIVGRYFKEFGFTVVFAMTISLFDALTVAPFLSAYFAGVPHKANNIFVRSFDSMQEWLEKVYASLMKYALRNPVKVLIITSTVFAISLWALTGVKKTFMPDSNFGEFMVSLEMPPETSLKGMSEVALKIEEKVKTVPEINYITTIIGNDQGATNIATLGIFLVSASERKRTSNEVKDELRKMLKEFPYAKPKVNNFQMGGGYPYPFYVNIIGDDVVAMEEYAARVIQAFRKIPDLTEINSSSQGGKPEFQVKMDPEKMQMVGVTPGVAGSELRFQIAGGVVGKYHQNGIEYDIRMRLKPEQRDLKSAFYETSIPNMMMRMIPLSAVATGEVKAGPAKIMRQDRSRIIQIFGNLVPGGAIGSATDMAKKILETEVKPPKGIHYAFVGQSEDFKDLIQNIILAFFLSFIFIYLVLSSLYESFITPVTILLALPPALSGAFFALFVTGEMFNMFSMIGVIMLMGIVTKNSILLVDFANEGVRSGLSRQEAIYRAGMVRLRPILMTTFAMVAGTLPLALGLGEAASFRQSMGIAIIGGLLISTLITLIVVPAVFEYIDIFREWIESRFRPAELKEAKSSHSSPSIHGVQETSADHFPSSVPEGKKSEGKS